jgi:transcriptional regulator with XRE-family HTH domain
MLQPKNESQIKFNSNKILFDEFLVKLNLTKMSETFGQWLKQKRKEKARTTKATVSLLEKDKIVQPRLENIDNIGKALGIPFEEMRRVFAEKFILVGPAIPEQIKTVGFDGLDEDDLKDIAEYIKFRKQRKGGS